LKNFKQIYKEADNKITGIAAAPGIVIGNVYLFSKEVLEINDDFITDVEEALTSFNEAMEKSKKELAKVVQLAKEKMEDTRAAIFEAQVMILDDPILIETITNRVVTEKRFPEFIVNDEITKYQNMMRHSAASYMKERANDIEDIKNRIIRNLQKKRWQSKIAEDVIVVSETLTPADAILFSKRSVKGFITDHGGLTSHAAIISRSLDIPAVVGTHNACSTINNGDLVIVDGFHGYVIFNPTEEQIKFFQEKIEHHKILRAELAGLKNEPASTIDGKEINLFANVDVTGEIDLVFTNDAKGIGLYRTEQILEETGDFPNEDEQTAIYNKLAERLYPKTITIRAFDIGGDKVKFLDFKEPNPFLGMRGIRVLLDNINIFKTQVKAVLRASKNKNVQLMVPMITTLEEVRKTRELVEICKFELKKEKQDFDKNMKLGIMIEVPSAAVMTFDLASEVDFISIGTNDLIQFLNAVDRGNDLVYNLYQEFSPGLIRTLSHVVSEGKRAKKVVSICGEMAADTLAIPLLVGLGLDNLSMAPTTIPYAKRIIRNCQLSDLQNLANECLALSSANDITEKIEKFFRAHQITRTRNLI
jgi:phosphotransferase system enzyme I (PtsI)